MGGRRFPGLALRVGDKSVLCSTALEVEEVPILNRVGARGSMYNFLHRVVFEVTSREVACKLAEQPV